MPDWFSDQPGRDHDQGRHLEFKSSKTFDSERLKNHLIREVDVRDREFCGVLCYMEPNCISYNLEKEPSANNEMHKCELNNSTHEGHEVDLVKSPSFVYQGAKVGTWLFHCKKLSFDAHYD